MVFIIAVLTHRALKTGVFARFYLRRRLKCREWSDAPVDRDFRKKDGVTVAVTIYDVVFDIATYVTLACQNCFSQCRHRRELSAMLNTRIR